MSAINWETIEKAIHTWVVAGSDLTASHVIWDYEGGKRPSLPYIEMSISDVDGVGHDWHRREYVSVDDNLKITYQGHRTAVLTLQCFGVPGRGDGAVPILSDVISALAMYEYDLDLAEVGIGTTGPVTLIQGQRGGILEPRGRVEVNLHLISELERRTDYIERISITVVAKNVQGTVLASTEVEAPEPRGFSDGFSSGFEV